MFISNLEKILPIWKRKKEETVIRTQRLYLKIPQEI